MTTVPTGELDDACQADLTQHAGPFPAQEIIDAAVLHLARGQRQAVAEATGRRKQSAQEH
jgi:hypothetical protein